MSTAGSEVQVASHVLVKNFLARKKNYSQRALARDLGVSPSFVCELIKGKKKIPERFVDRLIGLLDMDFESACLLKESLNTFSLQASPAKTELKENFEYLAVDQHMLLQKWYYPAMLELMTIPRFNGDFAAALGLSQYEVEYGLRVLLQLKLAYVDSLGNYHKTKSAIRLSSSKSKQAIRNYHKRMMDLAKSELSNTDQESFDKRFISGLSLTLAKKDVNYAKMRLSEFMHQLSLELSQGPVDSVYHMAVQLFPVCDEVPGQEAEDQSKLINSQ